jgi:hypothetical protein
LTTTLKTCLPLVLLCLLLACNFPLLATQNGENGPTPTTYEGATPTAAPSATPEPTATPAEGRTRVQFAPGSISAQVEGVIEQYGSDDYVLWAAEGQTISVALVGLPQELIDNQQILIKLWGQDGTVFLTDHSPRTSWQDTLPVSQDYYVTVESIAPGSVTYTLEVIIPPLSGDLPTLEELANCEYAWTGGETIALVDGIHYVAPPAGEPPEDYAVRLRDVPLAYGDLDSDGDADAAVILVERAGGTGIFYYVAAVLNEAGPPRGVAVAFLGDRVVLNTMGISDGVIALEGVAHGPDDPLCCPTLEWIWEYELSGGELVELPL